MTIFLLWLAGVLGAGVGAAIVRHLDELHLSRPEAAVTATVAVIFWPVILIIITLAWVGAIVIELYERWRGEQDGV